MFIVISFFFFSFATSQDHLPDVVRRFRVYLEEVRTHVGDAGDEGVDLSVLSAMDKVKGSLDVLSIIKRGGQDKNGLVTSVPVAHQTTYDLSSVDSDGVTPRLESKVAFSSVADSEPVCGSGGEKVTKTEGSRIKRNNAIISTSHFFEKSKMTSQMKTMGSEAESYLFRKGISQQIFDKLFVKVAGLITRGGRFLPACEDAGCQDQAIYWILLMRSYFSDTSIIVPPIIRNYLCAAYILSEYGQCTRGSGSFLWMDIPQRVGTLTQEAYLKMCADLSEEFCRPLLESRPLFDFFLNLRRVVSLHTKSALYPIALLEQLWWEDPTTKRKRRVPSFGHEISVRNVFALMKQHAIPGCVVAAYITGQSVLGSNQIIKSVARYEQHFLDSSPNIQDLFLCFQVNFLNWPREKMEGFFALEDFGQFQIELSKWAGYTDSAPHHVSPQRVAQRFSYATGKPDKGEFFSYLSSLVPRFGGTHVSILTPEESSGYLRCLNAHYAEEILQEPPRSGVASMLAVENES